MPWLIGYKPRHGKHGYPIAAMGRSRNYRVTNTVGAPHWRDPRQASRQFRRLGETSSAIHRVY